MAVASLFYLVLGGALILGGLGAAAGAMLAKAVPRRAGPLTVLAGFVISLLGALSLALLEYVIGPW